MSAESMMVFGFAALLSWHDKSQPNTVPKTIIYETLELLLQAALLAAVGYFLSLYLNDVMTNNAWIQLCVFILSLLIENFRRKGVLFWAVLLSIVFSILPEGISLGHEFNFYILSVLVLGTGFLRLVMYGVLGQLLYSNPPRVMKGLGVYLASMSLVAFLWMGICEVLF